MSIYAIIYLGLTFMGALILAKNHGKLKPIETWNFWYSTLLTAPTWTLLYLGGFFK